MWYNFYRGGQCRDNINKKTSQLLKEGQEKNQNLLSEEVTKKLSKSKSWLGDIESGRNRIYFEDIKKLCDLYEMSLNDLSKKIDKK